MLSYELQDQFETPQKLSRRSEALCDGHVCLLDVQQARSCWMVVQHGATGVLNLCYQSSVRVAQFKSKHVKLSFLEYQ